ncbi:MAG TPA: Ig-like domain-containing protein, partial [Thermoplasmata archaeon]|nr:Ig-like domain-containing protein [Thermoplasmata archaeon]
AQDNANASGVAYVELWYRLGSSGNFTRYNTTSNPNGQWTSSPIPFDAAQAAGDGSYEFYTIAVDVAGNAETAPAAADATIVVDTTAPAVTFQSPTEGTTVTSNATSILWQGSDALSGVLRYEISLDGGAFAPVGLQTSHGVTDLTDGSHYAIVRAIDRAGNVRDARVNFTVNTQVSPPSDFGILWWILAVIAAAGLGLFLFFFARRKKDKDEEKKQGREPPRTPPSFGSSKGPPSPPPPSP